MIVVTHEMGFASEVADEVIFMDKGKIVERNNTKSFFANPHAPPGAGVPRTYPAQDLGAPPLAARHGVNV